MTTATGFIHGDLVKTRVIMMMVLYFLYLIPNEELKQTVLSHTIKLSFRTYQITTISDMLTMIIL